VESGIVKNTFSESARSLGDRVKAVFIEDGAKAEVQVVAPCAIETRRLRPDSLAGSPTRIVGRETARRQLEHFSAEGTPGKPTDDFSHGGGRRGEEALIDDFSTIAMSQTQDCGDK